jgi:hypothetical protein
MPKAKKKRLKAKAKKKLPIQKQLAPKQPPSSPSFETEDRMVIADLKRIGIITGIILFILFLLFIFWH